MTAPVAAGSWFLGVDGGGTKTVAVAAGPDGSVRGIGRGGPLHPGWVGHEAAGRALREAVTGALQTSGERPRDCLRAHLGLAGVDSDSPDDPARVTFLTVLDDLGFRRDACEVDNDAYVGMAAALGPGPGVAVVAGTGFNAVAVGRDGRRAGVPWYVAGRGAGHILGRQAAMAALFDLRGAGVRTAMTALVVETLGLEGTDALEGWLRKRHTSRELGALAPAVSAAAAEGDAAAADMLRTAGLEFGLAALLVAREAGLDRGPAPCRVATIGGVFRAGAFVLAPMRDFLERSGVTCVLVLPEMPPAGGAVLMAWRGGVSTADAADRLRSDLRAALGGA